MKVLEVYRFPRASCRCACVVAPSRVHQRAGGPVHRGDHWGMRDHRPTIPQANARLLRAPRICRPGDTVVELEPSSRISDAFKFPYRKLADAAEEVTNWPSRKSLLLVASSAASAPTDLPLDYKRPDILRDYITNAARSLPAVSLAPAQAPAPALHRDQKRARQMALLFTPPAIPLT